MTEGNDHLTLDDGVCVFQNCLLLNFIEKKIMT